MSSLIRDKGYVDGQWVSAASGKTFAVTNPYNGELLANVADMDATDTKKAIDCAHKVKIIYNFLQRLIHNFNTNTVNVQAFETWRDTTAKERSALLRKWFELCNANQDELGRILCLEQGKPLAEAKGEVSYGSSFLEWFSEEARRINGDVSMLSLFPFY